MIGDYNRHIAEFSEGNLKKETINKTLKCYEAAAKKANGLSAFNPIKLGLYLNMSVFYYEILKNHKKAIEISKTMIEEAKKVLPNINEDAEENIESVTIYNLLKENLDMWMH